MRLKFYKVKLVCKSFNDNKYIVTGMGKDIKRLIAGMRGMGTIKLSNRLIDAMYGRNLINDNEIYCLKIENISNNISGDIESPNTFIKGLLNEDIEEVSDGKIIDIVMSALEYQERLQCLLDEIDTLSGCVNDEDYYEEWDDDED